MTEGMTTARTLAIGLIIRDALKQKEWTATALAEALGWSVTKVSRVMTGLRRTNPEDVIAILAVIGVVGQERDELVEFAKNLAQVSWWQEHGAQPTAQPIVLNRLERAAAHVVAYSADLVPRPFQTLGYLRQHAPQDSDEVATARLKAQHRLLASRSHLTSFIGARALTDNGFPAETLSEQIDHLRSLAGCAGITIRIVPETAAARRAGPFTLMTFDKHLPLVYLEHLNTSAYLEHPDTIAAYRNHLGELRDLAMDEQTSRTWLRDLVISRIAAEHDSSVAITDADGA